MTRRTRRRSNPVTIFILLVMIGFGIYLNRIVVPNAPQLFVPTLTPTRSAESYVSEGEQLFVEGKLDRAIAAYQQAIHSEPSNRSLYVALARLQVWNRQYEDALENSELALVGNEGYALAHAIRGWTLGFLDETLEAKAALKRALDLDPNSALAHAYYAEILANSDEYGDMDKAIEESKIAYNLAPTMLEVLRARAYILFVTGNFEQSIQMYQSAINVNKNIADLFLYMGYNYKSLSEYEMAIDYFRQANSLNPADPIPDLEASRIYATVGEFGKAVQYAELAVKDDPRNPHRYGNLGIMLYQAEDYSTAIVNLALAVHGGTSAEGYQVQGLPLDYGRIAQYYWFYGFALVYTNPPRCSEAVPIFQALINGVPADGDAVYNANYGLNLCREAIDSGLVGSESTTTP